jgi:type I restriction enzyme S subunit
MSNKEKTALVPKLRFPEFRGTEPWEQNTLKQVTTQLLDGDWIESKDQSDSGYRLIQTGNIGVGEFIAKSGKERFVSDETFERLRCTEVFPGDCLVSRLPDPAGRSCFVPDIGERMITAVDCTIVRFDKAKIVPYLFIAHTQTDGYFRKVEALSSGSTRQRISRDNLSGIWLWLPRSHTEQQKIADCLSSLDELIAAQARKVDALKTHKKGLIQQLFPREGETQPRLRFPEFQSSGDWVPVCVAQFAKVTTGAKDTQNKIEGGRYPFFVRSQTVERINSFSFDGEAVLTSGDGVGVGKNFHYIKGKFDFHQRVYCIFDFAQDVSGLFFYLYFSEHFGERVMRMSAKNSVDSVRMAMITEMPVMLPKLPEQQRIAECLTTLDELITTAAQEFETLRIHKKGLMQQLFPLMEEAT